MQYNTPKNLFLSALTKLSNLCLLILLIVAARVLGDKGYGELSIIMAFVYLFENITDLGLSDTTIKEVSREPEKGSEVLKSLLAWKALLCTVVSLVVFAICQFIDYSSEIKIGIYIYMVSTFAKSFKQLFLAVLKALNKFEIEAISVTAERVSILMIGTFVLLHYPTIINLMLVFCLVRIFDTSLIAYLVHRLIIWNRKTVSWKIIKKIQLQALPLGVYIYIMYLYGYIDTLMLSFLSNVTEVGWYNAAYRIYDGLFFLPLIVYHALLPPLAKYSRQDPDKHGWLSSVAIKYVFVGSLPIAVGLSLESHNIIMIVFGNGYEKAGDALMILAITLFFSYSSIMMHCILISIDKLRVILLAVLMGLIVNVFLNFVLIPAHGFLGAAIATACSEILVFGISLLYIFKAVEILQIKEKVWELLFLLTLGIAVFVLGSVVPWPSWILLVGFVITYSVCVVTLNVIDYKETVLWFKNGWDDLRRYTIFS